MPTKVTFHRNTAKRFIRLVVTNRNTPLLIRRVAEYYPFMICCSASVPDEINIGISLLKIRRELEDEACRYKCSFDIIRRKLTPVAVTLGLYASEDYQLASIQVDYYDILGVSPTANPLEIKKAFRIKALETHPDIISGDASTTAQNNEGFLLVQDAYNILSNPMLKYQYDISRKHQNIWQWSENMSCSDRLPFAMRTIGYPLMAIILAMGGIIIFANRLVQENSLNDGFYETISSVNAPKFHAERLSTTKDMPSRPISHEPAKAIVPLQNYSKQTSKEICSNDMSEKMGIGHLKRNTPVKSAMPSLTGHSDQISHQSAYFIKKLPKFKKKYIIAIPLPPKPSAGKNKQGMEVATMSALQQIQSQISKKPELSAAPLSLPPASIQKNRDADILKKLTIPSMDLNSLITIFLTHYCRAYETMNTDHFLSFFSKMATENNIPIYQRIPQYQNNFNHVQSIQYHIDPTKYIYDMNSNSILLHGRFALRWQGREDGKWRQSNGEIQMNLMSNGGSFLVRRLTYQFDRSYR